MAVSRYYDESKNPELAVFPGVPLTDLDDEQFDSYPAWLQASIDASAFYRKTNPKPVPRKYSAATDEKETE